MGNFIDRSNRTDSENKHLFSRDQFRQHPVEVYPYCHEGGPRERQQHLIQKNKGTNQQHLIPITSGHRLFSSAFMD